jgi:hypothetical protein
VTVLEVGQVGNLDYKIISAGRADDLFGWLKDNKYNYAGDEATLDHYVKQGWFFTVMKIDTMQMKKNPDGSYTGDITPTRFRFSSEKLVYPVKITQPSVKDQTEALFYVQAPYKVDLPGDFTYQYHWLSLLNQARWNFGDKPMPGGATDWLHANANQLNELQERAQKLGYSLDFKGILPLQGAPVAFPVERLDRLPGNQKSRAATTLEYAKRLTPDDIRILTGKVVYSQSVPDPDEGFTQRDLQDPKKADAIRKVIQRRLEKYLKERPEGYLVRDASEDDIKGLKLLAGHLQEGTVLTKFRKVFTREEMENDPILGPARLGEKEDRSEYAEVLAPPTPVAVLGWGGRFPAPDILLPKVPIKRVPVEIKSLPEKP